MGPAVSLAMKKSTHSPACCLCVSKWWAWVQLVSLLAGGCKPREWICEPIAYLEVVEPERAAGAAPFSIERLGREVDGLQTVPTHVTLKGDNRVYVGWMAYDFSYGSNMIYSPAEGFARDVDDPQDVHPMKRFNDGKRERVRFGFRSAACLGPDKYGSYVFCKYGKDELFLAADMTCRRK